jgi:ectoine hydroxylase-related dioxygenase (phytanoyl-CoA dioxygenase family)
VSTPSLLSRAQVDFYHREGYLAIDQLTTPEDVAALRESYDRIFAQQAGREEGNEFDLAGTDEDGKPKALPQILNPAKYAPEMNDSLLLRNARQAVRELLGPEASCNIAHAIFKPAQIGAETPWHQDAAYWNPGVIPRGISIWVPLQEATPENGCMYFVPRSHLLDIVPHQSINNDPRIHGLELAPSERHRVADAVACPLPPGGATFHGGFMFHYTPPNRSPVPRRALILMGGLPAIPRAQPLSYPWMAAKQTARSVRAQAAQAKAPPQG